MHAMHYGDRAVAGGVHAAANSCFCVRHDVLAANPPPPHTHTGAGGAAAAAGGTGGLSSGNIRALIQALPQFREVLGRLSVHIFISRCGWEGVLRDAGVVVGRRCVARARVLVAAAAGWLPGAADVLSTSAQQWLAGGRHPTQTPLRTQQHAHTRARARCQ
jgi:hypothetical protein